MTLRPLNPKDATVLVVEDDRNDAIITVRALETFGIKHIFHASTGEEAVAFLSSNHCDVALVDFNLPGMNGLRLLRKLQELRPELSVIFVTGARDEKVAVEALKSGAVDYVSKDELLTSGIINSLQDALRASGRADEERDDVLLGQGREAAYDAALAEADWLVSPADAEPRSVMPPLLATEDRDAQDARDAFVRYLDACMEGRPFKSEEQGLIRLLVERGASPAEIVMLFRSAVRAIQIGTAPDARDAAVRPFAALTRILAGLVDEYQGQLSVQVFQRHVA